MAILALMVVRFVVRLATPKPVPATIGSPALDRLAPVTHYGFYILVLLMAGTGLATAILARLNEIVFARSGAPLPPDFAAYPSFSIHAVLALLLVASCCTSRRHSIITSCARMGSCGGCGTGAGRTWPARDAPASGNWFRCVPK
jgi:hypothetical protein